VPIQVESTPDNSVKFEKTGELPSEVKIKFFGSQGDAESHSLASLNRRGIEVEPKR
jgi:hypothetical protein